MDQENYEQAPSYHRTQVHDLVITTSVDLFTQLKRSDLDSKVGRNGVAFTMRKGQGHETSKRVEADNRLHFEDFRPFAYCMDRNDFACHDRRLSANCKPLMVQNQDACAVPSRERGAASTKAPPDREKYWKVWGLNCRKLRLHKAEARKVWSAPG